MRSAAWIAPEGKPATFWLSLVAAKALNICFGVFILVENAQCVIEQVVMDNGVLSIGCHSDTFDRCLGYSEPFFGYPNRRNYTHNHIMGRCFRVQGLGTVKEKE